MQRSSRTHADIPLGTVSYGIIALAHWRLRRWTGYHRLCADAGDGTLCVYVYLFLLSKQLRHQGLQVSQYISIDLLHWETDHANKHLGVLICSSHYRQCHQSPRCFSSRCYVLEDLSRWLCEGGIRTADRTLPTPLSGGPGFSPTHQVRI